MIQAKFKVIEVRQMEGSERVALAPAVDPKDKKDTNLSWSVGPHVGRIDLTVTEKSAFGKFKIGQLYTIDIKPSA